jgi:phenylalanyl-tRNA synthetase beta chain
MSKFPPIRRDIAVIVNNHINVQTIISSLNENKPEIVTEIELFDIYRGNAVGENNKSLAFKVMLQDTEKTLTDEDAEAAISSLLQVLEMKFDATLRH